MRGYLMSSLSARPRAAVWIAAVAFTVPHLQSDGGQQGWLQHLIYLALPFGFSVSAGYLAILTRSVWAAVGIHGGFHLGTVVLVILGLDIGSPVLWIVLGSAHLVAGLLLSRRIPSERWEEVAALGPYAAR